MGQRLEGAAGNGTGEVNLEPSGCPSFQRRQILHDHQAPPANDSHPVGDPLDLRQDMGGEEDGPSLFLRLLHHPVELLLHQRVEPAGRFVEDQQLRMMHEGLDEPHLLFVAAGQIADGSLQVELQPLRQLSRLPDSAQVSQMSEMGQQLLTGEALVEGELPRQVADPAA